MPVIITYGILSERGRAMGQKVGSKEIQALFRATYHFPYSHEALKFQIVPRTPSHSTQRQQAGSGLTANRSFLLCRLKRHQKYVTLVSPFQ